jgi:hypothetical protein
MIWRIVERNVAFLLMGMIVLDLVLFVRNSSAERRIENLDVVVKSVMGSEAIPKPVGFRRDGTRIDVSSARKGWVIRYAGNGCKFCLQDTQWKNLAGNLQHAGFDVIVLLPGPQEEFPKNHLVPEGAPQEAFIDSEWIKHFRLLVTPTVLLFDSHQRLIWHRQGMLGSSDVSSALDAVSDIR